MGVSPRVHWAQVTPPAEGRGRPEGQLQRRAVSVPPAPTHASLGEEALGSRRSRPPLGALPLPSRAQVHLASLSQTLLGDGSGVRTPGSGPSGSETAGPDAKTPGCADKRWGDLGVSQALLQILVIFSLQLLLPRKSS